MLGIRDVVRKGWRIDIAIVTVFALTFPVGASAASPFPDPVFENNLTNTEQSQLAEAAAKVRKSVFFVGHPNGSHGTAILVSKERRLLATAAHVADIADECGSLIAIPDGSTASYRVQRIYYHPDVMRILDQGLHVRSDRVEDGVVSTRAPDVALLELAAGGPELPEACLFATDAEFRALDHSPIVALGHPGSDADAWPAGVRRLAARHGVGRMRSLTGFPPRERDLVPFESRRRLVYDRSVSEKGFSGGPLCLSNGHVIALVCYHSFEREPDQRGFGVRIDCVREMLGIHLTPHHLPPLKLPVPVRTNVFDFSVRADLIKSQTGWISDRPPVADPRLPQLRQAVKELKEAETLIESHKYAQSVAICNRLIMRFPDYGKAYDQRAFSYLMYSYEFNKNSVACRQYLTWARDDYQRASELDPDLAVSKADAFDCRMYLAREKDVIAELRSLITEAGAEIDTPERTPWDTARFLAVRANYRMLLNDLNGAKIDIGEAIRLAPDWSSYWDKRAEILDRLKEPDAAEESRRISEELGKPKPSDRDV